MSIIRSILEGVTRLMQLLEIDGGIRSRGPGKFGTILDSYVYGATMEGGADVEVSYPDGKGWFGFVRMDRDMRAHVAQLAREDNNELTVAELEMLNENSAIILHERSDGYVESTWYHDVTKATRVWDKLEAEVSAPEAEVSAPEDEYQSKDEWEAGHEDDEEDPWEHDWRRGHEPE